jgi:hypothetical protein
MEEVIAPVVSDANLAGLFAPPNAEDESPPSAQKA